MICSEVRERLIPWHDGEVGPSEAALLSEHVEGCASCAAFDQRLRATAPRPPPVKMPPDISARLDAAFDIDALLAKASEPAPAPARSWWSSGRALLLRRTEVPLGAVVAYLLLLAASLAFGLSGWYGAPEPARTAGSPEGIPADQFRPAAFEP